MENKVKKNRKETSSKYSFEKYVYFSRWISYWYQINEVLNLKPKNCLIIGVGDGIVVDIIKKYIGEVKTLDIDEELKPDFITSVEKIPLQDASFDVILCAEVLEHLPFNKFDDSLNELRRLSKKYVILSLPHFGPIIKLNFKIPFLKEVKTIIKIPFPIKHKINEHHWELGKRGYSLERVRRVIRKYFKIEKEFIPFDNQYHHFFRLKKYEINLCC